MYCNEEVILKVWDYRNVYCYLNAGKMQEHSPAQGGQGVMREVACSIIMLLLPARGNVCRVNTIRWPLTPSLTFVGYEH